MLATVDEEQQWIEFLKWCNDKDNADKDVPTRFHLHSEAQTVRLRAPRQRVLRLPRIDRVRLVARAREELAVLRARFELNVLGLKVWLRS